MFDFIPVIDLFAGPGGLGEGHASFEDSGKKPFKIVLSIEKDPTAFETLKLRSFFVNSKRKMSRTSTINIFVAR